MKLFSINYLSVFAVAFMLVVACRKPACENCTPASPNPENKFPIAVAGADQLIFLPADSFRLDGTASVDPDGSIVKWQWRKLSGPASFQILQPDSATTIVRNLQAGIYQFMLTITDNNNANAADTIQLHVNDFAGKKVFMAGYYQRTVLGFTIRRARLVADDVILDLSDGQIDAVANSVCVENGIVYTAGILGNSAVVWKNSTPSLLAQGRASDVVVLNGDVYVAGESGGAAMLWKNGVSQSLSNSRSPLGSSMANDLFIYNDDVYVAGYVGTVAVVWRNGEIVQQFSVDPSVGTVATGVHVANGELYVSGYTWDFFGTVGTYLWKNGVVQPLQNNNGGTGFTSKVLVAGQDVFVAGYLDNKGGVVWKNGKIIYTGKFSYNDITIKASDLYAAGGFPNHQPDVTGWLRKNLEETSVPGLSSVNGVFVR